MKIKLLQLLLWFKNLFSRKGRKENYFTNALKNVRKAAVKKIKSRKEAKQAVVDYVRWLQTGPKKSNYEISELVRRKGLKTDANGNVITPSLFGVLKLSGVRTNWKQMQFLN